MRPSGFAVAKKAPSPRNKFFQKKKLFHRICAEMIFKTLCGNFLKINGSRDIYSEKLFFTITLLIKLDRQKINKIPHTVLETIISQIIS